MSGPVVDLCTEFVEDALTNLPGVSGVGDCLDICFYLAGAALTDPLELAISARCGRSCINVLQKEEDISIEDFADKFCTDVVEHLSGEDTWDWCDKGTGIGDEGTVTFFKSSDGDDELTTLKCDGDNHTVVWPDAVGDEVFWTCHGMPSMPRQRTKGPQNMIGGFQVELTQETKPLGGKACRLHYRFGEVVPEPMPPCGAADQPCCFLGSCSDGLACDGDYCRKTPYTPEDNAEVQGDVFTCKPSTGDFTFVGADYANAKQVECLYTNSKMPFPMSVTARPAADPPYRPCGFGVADIPGKEGVAYGNWQLRKCLHADPADCSFTYTDVQCPSDGPKNSGICEASQGNNCASKEYSCYAGVSPTLGQCNANASYFDSRTSCDRYCLVP